MGIKSRAIGSLLTVTTMLALFQHCGRESMRELPSVQAFDTGSLKLRQEHCARCHQSPVLAEPSRILDDRFLIENGWIVPGNPGGSPLFSSLFTNMPKDSRRLHDNEIDIFEKWILNLEKDGRRPAHLSISDGPTYDFGSVVNGGVSDHSFTITNDGERPAAALTGTGLADPFTFKDGAFPGTGGNCSSLLEPQRSCTIVVSFTPTAPTTYNDFLEILYVDGQTSTSQTLLAKIAVQGQGTGTTTASLTLSNSPVHDFGNIAVGASGERIFTLKNAGSATASNLTTDKLSNDFSFKGGNFPGTGGTCSSSLTAGSSCLIVVSFAPMTSGLKSDNLNVKYATNSMNLSVTTMLRGTGTQDNMTGSPANLLISNGPSYGFGSVTNGNFADFIFTVQNTGALSATAISGAALQVPFAFRGGNFPGTGGNCGTTLSAGSSCTIAVRFQPTTANTFNTNLKLDYNNGSAITSTTRTMTGTGLATPLANLSVDFPSFDFGPVKSGETAEKIFVVKNDGAATATNLNASALNSAFKYKGGSYPGNGGTCASSLSMQATCRIVVTYSPSKNSAETASLSINYNNASASRTLTVSLSGTGVGAGKSVYYSDIIKILDESGCNGCHSADWKTSYAGLMAFKKSPQTTSAIVPGSTSSRFIERLLGQPSTLPRMGAGVYGSISATNLQKVMNWIAQGAKDDPAGSITQSFRHLQGDRFYIASVIRKVYGNAGYIDNITLDLTSRGDLFGSPCYREDAKYVINNQGLPVLMHNSMMPNDRCLGQTTDEVQLHAEVVPVSSTVSEAIRQSMCLRLADRMDATESALTRASLSSDSAFDETNIAKAYSRFYPGSTPSAETLNDLVQVGQTAIARPTVVAAAGKTKSFEGWRFIFLSLCLSPGWQAP